MTADELDRRRSKPGGKIDFKMMYFSHDAFKRDLHRMADAAGVGRARETSVRNGWEMFKKQLHVHHVAEDICIWPPMREKAAGRPEDLAVLDLMEAEHGRIDPMLARVDAAIEADAADLATSIRELADALVAHMEHEEERALPLVETYLGVPGWEKYIQYLRKTQGLKGGGEYLAWLLDEAPESTKKQVLDMLPPPVRLLYRSVFRPAYERTPRWSPAA